MGKKKGSIPQKEQFQRIQYLYQVIAIVTVVFALKKESPNCDSQY
jgi:hypothetical protein